MMETFTCLTWLTYTNVCKNISKQINGMTGQSTLKKFERVIASVGFLTNRY